MFSFPGRIEVQETTVVPERRRSRMMLKLMTIAAGAVLALGAGLALAACGSDDDNGAGGAYGGSGATEETTSKKPPPVPTIVLRNGKPVGGMRELAFDSGEQVRFRVRSDVADEIHVHGYDLTADVAAGDAIAFAFPADIEGIFEVESHESGEQIAELRIEP